MNHPKRETLLCGVDELRSRLRPGAVSVIDCHFDLTDPRAGRTAYLRQHIPGAAYADLDRDLAGPVTCETGRHPLPAIDDMAASLRRLGVSNGVPVVVYDACSGAVASRAWWLLRWLGHEDVRVLDGGLPAWQEQGLPLESGSAEVESGDFLAEPRPDLVLGTDEVVASLDEIASLRLVDARDVTRFRGETEPIDPVAGHIPGTRNVPYSHGIDENGRWKPQAALDGIWRDVLGESRSEPWAVMCGSGVTACHLAISGMLAGFREPRLYVGSWSEWIRDPRRPVATGPV